MVVALEDSSFGLIVCCERDELARISSYTDQKRLSIVR